MSEQTEWTFNAPTGVFENAVLSSRVRSVILDTAELVALTEWMAPVPKRRGETICVPCVREVKGPIEPLAETQGIPPAFDVKTIEIKVQEMGRAVPYTSLNDMRVYDPESAPQSALINQGRLIYNALIASCLRRTPNKIVLGVSPKGDQTRRVIKDGDLTEPRFQGRLGRWLGNLNRRPIYARRECLTLRDVAAAMCEVRELTDRPVTDAILVGTPRALRVLRRDKEFETWHTYASASDKLHREIGRFPNCCRVIECTSLTSSYIGTGTEAFLVVGTPVLGAEAQPLELRAAIPTDFGREKSVALYGILGCSLADENKVIHFCGADRPRSLRQRFIQWRADRRLIRRKRRAKLLYGIMSALSERVYGWYYDLQNASRRYEEDKE